MSNKENTTNLCLKIDILWAHLAHAQRGSLNF